jgi:hypothetical protein
VRFSYPSNWSAQAVTSLTPGPGLTFTHASAVAATTDPRGQLIVGTTASRSPATPLPTQFIAAELSGTPTPERVTLGGRRFYRVRDPLLPLGAKSQYVYALASGTGAVVALCKTRTQNFIALCEQVLATLSAPPARVLAPRPSPAKLAYAHALNAIIAKLNAARRIGAKALAASTVALTEAKAARTLALAHTEAADAVAALSTPGPATAAANTALEAALRRVSVDYTALGDAAAVVAPVTYNADRKLVDAANTALGAALRRLKSLGYRIA